MRITIVTTTGKIVSGQARVLLEYARHLTRRGHRVVVCKTMVRHLTGKTSLKIRSAFSLKKTLYRLSGPEVRRYGVSWFKADFPFLTIPETSSRYLPESDFVIFSSPGLIDRFSEIPADRGKPVFLVQCGLFSESPRTVPDSIFLVAISSRLQENLKKHFPEREPKLLVNGVNLHQFSNPEKVFRPTGDVGMIFYQKKPPHKGLEDGLRAFEIAREKYPGLHLKMAGEKRERWLPSYVEFWNGINQENLVEFYRSLDIFLYPSRLDACPLPPMEALACKCGLVTTDVSGILDFTIPGKTALVSPVGDVEALARNLTSLVANPEKLKELSVAGYEKIKEFSYENQARKLENILKNSL